MDELKVGDEVERGPNWKWSDQDGGVGNKGTIVGKSANDWCQVKWENGHWNGYEYNDETKDIQKVVVKPEKKIVKIKRKKSIFGFNIKKIIK